ncbi:hypothetical protein [Salegentibacter sp. T436]|uniref:hypothetical protein n=1 Tax=Salegentibacter sp. T436 TaxID=1729720 RepID=UPI00094A92D9|nr:hypothetical protein [Salegentibacter sp. T436]APS40019.1 hypothetical protein AO058_14545 [Salegentibacter sp. T436]
MKKFFTLIVVLSLLSCDTEENDENQISSLDLVFKELPQEWKLIKMTGSFEGSDTTGEEMYWQETYSFSEDGTFTKSRTTEDGETLKASGEFIISQEMGNPEKALVLTYEEEQAIIGNCYNIPVEYLYYSNDEELLLSNWWACDGPGLFYERIE